MSRSRFALIMIVVAGLAAAIGVPSAQAPSPAAGKAPAHAKQVKRLLIKNAMIIPGTGVPASGPSDILVEDGVIARIGNSTVGKWPDADAIIDAGGKYVMPGDVV